MKSKGFTLIELMITVAILAIIVGIAVPAYNGQMERSRRADAMAGLLQAAQQMERCFTRTNTYTGCNSQIPSTSPDGHYGITVAVADGGTTFTLTADPEGAGSSGAQKDDACGSYTLDHLGRKDAGGGATDRCWGS